MSAASYLSHRLCSVRKTITVPILMLREIDPNALTISGIGLFFVAGCLEGIDLEIKRAKRFLTGFRKD